jgi:CheY-like chemotaxis protein
MLYGRVLVVDDLPTNLDVMTGLLMPYGLAADTVQSGREAVDRIRAGEPRYDLVFMDHMMPEMDGLEAARIIRNEIGSAYAREVPIIVLTANAVAGNQELFMKSGFSDFISKPIDIKRLDMALNQWVRDKQSAETLKNAERAARERAEASAPCGDVDDAGRWLLARQVEGADFDAALALYGGSGAAFIPILKSFVAHTPLLLDKMGAYQGKSLTDYAVAVHGLKGACSAVCAGGAAAMALELETASRAGDAGFVRAHHGELYRRSLGLVEHLRVLLMEWEAAGKAESPPEEKERRVAPDRALLVRLSAAAAGFNSGAVEEVLGELERYQYDREGGLIWWLRQQVENFDYDIIHRRLEGVLAGRKRTGKTGKARNA